MADEEIHFFDKADRYARGRSWYESHFEGAAPNQQIGEKTPDYLWTTADGAEQHRAGVHERIHSAYPNVKLIVTLRNPVDRAASALNHLVRTGRLSPLQDPYEVLFGEKHSLIAGHGVLEKGYYYSQIQAYLDRFDREQFFFLIFEEDIVQTPSETFADLCRFLDVVPGRGPSDHQLQQQVWANRRSFPGLLLQYYLGLPRQLMKAVDWFLPSSRLTFDPEVRRRLHTFYAEENEQLFAFLDRHPTAWQRPDPAHST